MKICVVSDSHGEREILERIVRINPDCDIYLHLGDSLLPDYLISPFVSLKGNNDYLLDYPSSRIIKTEYCNIYCEHGHIHGIGNSYLLEKNNCKVYLYGHTHVHKLEKIKDYYFVNPGSTSLPRDGSNGTYLIIKTSIDNIEFEFKEL